MIKRNPKDMQRSRDKKRAAGLIRVEFWVTPEVREKLKAYLLTLKPEK